MNRHYLAAQTRTQNAVTFGVETLAERAKQERGEIGSTLILMAILVGAAIFASTILRGAITGLVNKIADAINGQDATSGA